MLQLRGWGRHMQNESVFLHNLVGKRVRIVAVDEDDLPPLTLREISGLGVVAEDSAGPHFYPWAEIVEISPAKNAAVDWAPLA